MRDRAFSRNFANCNTTSDVMMPVMSGDVMTTKMRESPELRAIPVLLLTAKADDQLRLRMLEEGGTARLCMQC